ncbi:putative C6 transcription factor [Coniochaeta sp. 2T2.1]|nr:putative C6 transcription factor [Coniochaeta sp. 2T2.1]
MPYTCQACAKRKVKCDKSTPSCSSCRKGKIECVYQAPAPRARKRKLNDDESERLARYERILREHGLLDAEKLAAVEKSPPAGRKLASQDAISLYWNEPNNPGTGKLVAGHGKSRYIDSNLWRNLGDDEMQQLSDHEEDEDEAVGNNAESSVSDPLTGALLGAASGQGLLQYHPSQADALFLWQTHRDNIEPICKILHIPSTASMVERVSQQPGTASKTDECLLFAIYHFAVYSMTEEECVERLGQSRHTLMQRYHFTTRQALVNVYFLKTTELSVLQAYVLLLNSCRHSYDPHTYWILTGIAVRIAQRMGLHREGERLGLPPFDVQMRRRLFYQLLPLDGHASQMSGTGISIMPDSWDTEHPMNINDNQIWPGMTEKPQEQHGATEMIFCLSRSWVGRFFAKAGKSPNATGAWHAKEYQEAEAAIKEAENEVEEKYIRYCDIANPLHFLTIGLARSGVSFMRLRVRLPKIRNNTATDPERREMLQLAQKIIDTDTAANSHPGLQRFAWHVRPFFLWGTWDALILILSSLWKRPDLFSPSEMDAAWDKVKSVYQNHGEFLKAKRTLHVAFGRLTLRAWEANPPSRSVPEPDFIASLRSQRIAKKWKRAAAQDIRVEAAHRTTDTTNLATTISTPTDANASADSGSDMGLWMSNDFDLQAADWIFWDQLIQGDRQELHGQQFAQ